MIDKYSVLESVEEPKGSSNKTTKNDGPSLELLLKNTVHDFRMRVLSIRSFAVAGSITSKDKYTKMVAGAIHDFACALEGVADSWINGTAQLLMFQHNNGTSASSLSAKCDPEGEKIVRGVLQSMNENIKKDLSNLLRDSKQSGTTVSKEEVDQTTAKTVKTFAVDLAEKAGRLSSNINQQQIEKSTTTTLEAQRLPNESAHMPRKEPNKFHFNEYSYASKEGPLVRKVPVKFGPDADGDVHHDRVIINLVSSDESNAQTTTAPVHPSRPQTDEAIDLTASSSSSDNGSISMVGYQAEPADSAKPISTTDTMSFDWGVLFAPSDSEEQSNGSEDDTREDITIGLTSALSLQTKNSNGSNISKRQRSRSPAKINIFDRAVQMVSTGTSASAPSSPMDGNDNNSPKHQSSSPRGEVETSSPKNSPRTSPREGSEQESERENVDSRGQHSPRQNLNSSPKDTFPEVEITQYDEQENDQTLGKSSREAAVMEDEGERGDTTAVMHQGLSPKSANGQRGTEEGTTHGIKRSDGGIHRRTGSTAESLADSRISGAVTRSPKSKGEKRHSHTHRGKETDDNEERDTLVVPKDRTPTNQQGGFGLFENWFCKAFSCGNDAGSVHAADQKSTEIVDRTEEIEGDDGTNSELIEDEEEDRRGTRKKVQSEDIAQMPLHNKNNFREMRMTQSSSPRHRYTEKFIDKNDASSPATSSATKKRAVDDEALYKKGRAPPIVSSESLQRQWEDKIDLGLIFEQKKDKIEATKTPSSNAAEKRQKSKISEEDENMIVGRIENPSPEKERSYDRQQQNENASQENDKRLTNGTFAAGAGAAVAGAVVVGGVAAAATTSKKKKWKLPSSSKTKSGSASASGSFVNNDENVSIARSKSSKSKSSQTSKKLLKRKSLTKSDMKGDDDDRPELYTRETTADTEKDSQKDKRSLTRRRSSKMSSTKDKTGEDENVLGPNESVMNKVNAPNAAKGAAAVAGAGMLAKFGRKPSFMKKKKSKGGSVSKGPSSTSSNSDNRSLDLPEIDTERPEDNNESNRNKNGMLYKASISNTEGKRVPDEYENNSLIHSATLPSPPATFPTTLEMFKPQKIPATTPKHSNISAKENKENNNNVTSQKYTSASDESKGKSPDNDVESLDDSIMNFLLDDTIGQA